jgi:carboxypeptidase C (cathepsin A)
MKSFHSIVCVPRALGLFLVLSLLTLESAAASDETEKGAKAKAETPVETPKSSETPAPEPKLSMTQHSVVIGGNTVSYKATVGYLLLKQEVDSAHSAKADESKKTADSDEQKEDLKPRAKIFFIAYTRDGQDKASRPVTFAFNGGPGAASVWLHLGALGPRRVKLTELGDGPPAPYMLVENDSSWLDDTDLVFIDPVSTGYSRPAHGESAQTFHSYEEDIKSVAEFIRLFTTRNKRWLSPKFIIGESYGAARAAGLTAYLQDEQNLYVNGVMLVSGLLNSQDIDFSHGNDLPFTLFLPGYATTAWFHKKLAPELQGETAAEVRKEAEDFANSDYLLALAQGNALTDEAQKQIAEKLSRLTGLPVDLILRYHLRIPCDVFREELLKSGNRVVGRFDSRFTGIGYDPRGNHFDPSFEALRGAYTATINDYLRNDLKFETDLPYETLANISWDMGNVQNKYLEVEQTLGRAMSQNPAMKVWVAAGYYDLAISYAATEHALRQMFTDPALRANISLTTYEGGHMLYNYEPNLKKFKSDFQTFLNNTLHPKTGE